MDERRQSQLGHLGARAVHQFPVSAPPRLPQIRWGRGACVCGGGEGGRGTVTGCLQERAQQSHLTAHATSFLSRRMPIQLRMQLCDRASARCNVDV
eukprot:357237-Chlamydomonas_euryale.AAC.2